MLNLEMLTTKGIDIRCRTLAASLQSPSIGIPQLAPMRSFLRTEFYLGCSFINASSDQQFPMIYATKLSSFRLLDFRNLGIHFDATKFRQHPLN